MKKGVTVNHVFKTYIFKTMVRNRVLIPYTAKEMAMHRLGFLFASFSFIKERKGGKGSGTTSP